MGGVVGGKASSSRLRSTSARRASGSCSGERGPGSARAFGAWARGRRSRGTGSSRRRAPLPPAGTNVLGQLGGNPGLADATRCSSGTTDPGPGSRASGAGRDHLHPLRGAALDGSRSDSRLPRSRTGVARGLRGDGPGWAVRPRKTSMVRAIPAQVTHADRLHLEVRSATSSLVVPLITTVLGAASPWRRATTLTAAPTTSDGTSEGGSRFGRGRHHDGAGVDADPDASSTPSRPAGELGGVWQSSAR